MLKKNRSSLNRPFQRCFAGGFIEFLHLGLLLFNGDCAKRWMMHFFCVKIVISKVFSIMSALSYRILGEIEFKNF